MDEETLKRLWEYNSQFGPDEFAPASKKRKAEQPESWGGGAIRCMLTLLYVISFLCLLRYDEALKIQWHWIVLRCTMGQPGGGASKYRCRFVRHIKPEVRAPALSTSSQVTLTKKILLGRDCSFLPLRRQAEAVVMPRSRLCKVGAIQPGPAPGLRLPQESRAE
jgi:hypothetical protein